MKTRFPQSVFHGTALLFLGRSLSRFLGLIREVLSAAYFGAGMAMDCFNLSYTIVIGLRQLFAEQFLTPIIPVYFKRKEEDGEEAALQSLASITVLLNIIALVISIIILIWAKHLIQFLAPGFNQEKIELSTILLRWFAIGGIGIILHRYYTGLFTCFFQFTAIAFAPLFLNVFTILLMVFFAVRFGVISLATGFSAGFLAYLFILIYFLPHRGDLLRIHWKRNDPGVASYGILILPLFMAVVVEQVQLFVDRALASGLPEGALSAQGYAIRLVKMLSDFIIGTFGTVVFPIFSLLASGDKKEEFARNFSLAFQGVFLVLALAVSIIVGLALPIVRIIFERGAFTFSDSIVTAKLVVYYSFAYSAQALLIVIIRGFHAYGNTRTPMYTTIVSVMAMITMDFLLIGPMGISGLALAMVIGFSLNMILVYILFTTKFPWKIMSENLRTGSLCIFIAALLGYGMNQAWHLLDIKDLVDSFLYRVVGVVILAGIGSALYFAILKQLHLPALEYIIKKIRNRRTHSISTEPEDY